MLFLSPSTRAGIRRVILMDRRNSSGQILLVAVLIIALALLSTELYVYEVGKPIDEVNPDSFSDFIFAVKLGSEHVVVGSLANISKGGANQTLEINLERLSSFVGRQYKLGKYVLDFTSREETPYSSGIWISWGTNGSGVSGAYTNFTLRLSDQGVDVNLKYTINITTTLRVQGTYNRLQGDSKEVSVTCALSNEGSPALAENVTLCYKSLDEWLIPGPQNNYTIIDYGNGTHAMTFVADISSQDVEVSVHACDQREINVQANVTCIET